MTLKQKFQEWASTEEKTDYIDPGSVDPNCTLFVETFMYENNIKSGEDELLRYAFDILEELEEI